MYSLVNFSSSDIIAFMTFSEAVFITALKIVHTSSAEILSFSRTTTYSVFAASGWSREKFVCHFRILVFPPILGTIQHSPSQITAIVGLRICCEPHQRMPSTTEYGPILCFNIPHFPFFFRLCIQYAEFPAQKNAAPKALLQNYNRIEVLFPFFLIASIR